MSMDAWIERQPDEIPCDHRNAEWRHDDTILFCRGCHEELAVVTSEPCVCDGSPCQRCGGTGYFQSMKVLGEDAEVQG